MTSHVHQARTNQTWSDSAVCKGGSSWNLKNIKRFEVTSNYPSLAAGSKGTYDRCSTQLNFCRLRQKVSKGVTSSLADEQVRHEASPRARTAPFERLALNALEGLDQHIHLSKNLVA